MLKVCTHLHACTAHRRVYMRGCPPR